MLVFPTVWYHSGMASSTTDRTRWAALYVLCAGVLMIVLDATIVNVALPTIQDDLGFSQSNLAWVVNAYLIAFGGLLWLAFFDVVHHRGQLSTYVRPMGGKVPSIYGPSADEPV
jgi:MFS family permease